MDRQQPTENQLRRVLVVDDDADARKATAMALSQASMEVSTAANGLVALRAVAAALEPGAPFHAILLDLQMPVLDGLTTTRCLRNEQFDGLIIALSGSPEASDVTCHAAGCDKFVPKPCRPGTLIDIIESHMTHTAQ